MCGRLLSLDALGGPAPPGVSFHLYRYFTDRRAVWMKARKDPARGGVKSVTLSDTSERGAAEYPGRGGPHPSPRRLPLPPPIAGVQIIIPESLSEL